MGVGVTDALDQSWGRVDPAAAKAAGIKVIVGYLSYDPSKNWTAAQIRAYHAHGIGVLLNWESLPGRPLEGAAAGQADAAEAVAQARALVAQVGAPSGRIAIVFSCDRDVSATQWPAIDAYYRATKQVVNAAGFANGVYGEVSLIDHLHDAGLTEVEWQTLAWSYGNISDQADLYQQSINNTLAGTSVDFDQIRHAATLGAWWPPGSAESSLGGGVPLQPPSVPVPGDDMSAADVAAINAHLDSKLQGLATLLLYGDGKDATDATNTHPDNLRRTRAEIGDLRTALSLLAVGDGRNMSRGSDTHPFNVKNALAAADHAALAVAALTPILARIEAGAQMAPSGGGIPDPSGIAAQLTAIHDALTKLATHLGGTV